MHVCRCEQCSKWNRNFVTSFVEDPGVNLGKGKTERQSGRVQKYG